MKVLQGLIVVLVLSAFGVQAANQASDQELEQKLGKQADVWSGLDHNEYVNQQLACQLKVKEQQWANTIWPKENKTAKPLFADRIDIDKLESDIRLMIKKEQLLAQEFDFKITTSKLQTELRRMAANTQDPEKLKMLFGVLKNDANTLAECVARSNIVKSAFINQFNSNESIHREIKAQAQTELNHYLINQKNSNLSVQPMEVNYVLESGEINPNTNPKISQLSEDKFAEKLAQYSQKNKFELKEKQYSFVYQELIRLSDKSIQINVMSWPKVKMHDWLSQKQSISFKVNTNHDLHLPKITALEKSYNQKSGPIIGDTWAKRLFTPEARTEHTAVWTGAEMIIWGGTTVNANSGFINTGGKYNPVTDTWEPTSTVSVPTVRMGHVAVWTGTEMLIWGGRNLTAGAGNAAIGGKYNPQSDNWTVLTTAGSPNGNGRREFEAIWTGTEMIVWGGNFSGNHTQTGGRYDPTLNSWNILPITVDTPTARSSNSVVWTGSKMIVWGGWSGSYLKTGSEYDPVTNSWAPITTPTISARLGHTAVWAGSEMIVWGGQMSGSGTHQGARYNLLSDSWILLPTAGQSDSRYNHTAVWTGAEMIVWGGRFGKSDGSRYSPSSDSWSGITNNNTPSGRQFHTAIWTGAEMIVWGGDNFTPKFKSGGRYNPTSNTWQDTLNVDSSVSPVIKRERHSAIWNGSKMIVWGGFDGVFPLNRGGRYDPAIDFWEETDNMGVFTPQQRISHTAVWNGTEMIVWGGYDFTLITEDLNSGASYDELNDQWNPMGIIMTPLARRLHTAVWTANGMLIWGGDTDGSGSSTNTGAYFDPADGIWTPISSSGATARFGHTVVLTDDEMIVWGGETATGVRSDSGERYDLDNNTWTSTSTTGSPSARNSHTAVWSGEEMVVWGGETNSGAVNSGAKYNPIDDSWSSTSVANVPTIRREHVAVWTGNEMIVWGGTAGSGPLNTGGRYHPETDTWLATTTVDAPVGARLAEAVWAGDSMLVFGGSESDGAGGQLNSYGQYYPAESYAVSGTVTGLTGDKVVLQNNLGDDLEVTADGSFTFGTELIQGSDYSITVLTQPMTPSQECTITNGSGTNISSNVSNIIVNCETVEYTISVNVTGLASGNTVQFSNGSDILEVTANGIHVFDETLIGGTVYSVVTSQQPESPNQTCAVDESGTITDMDVEISVGCVTTQYQMAVVFSGLDPLRAYEVTDGQTMMMSSGNASTSFDPVDDGTAYDVSYTFAEPLPEVLCEFDVSNSGVFAGSNITVNINCETLQRAVNVNVSGLAVGNTVSFSNSTDTLDVSSNGEHTVSMIDDNMGFDVDITAQPEMPNQVCSFTNADDSATNLNTDKTIEVGCVTTQYTVGVNVSGLINGIVLENNLGDVIAVGSNGLHIFPSFLDDGEMYQVTIQSQPVEPSQTCTLNDQIGIVNGAHVTDVTLNCVTDQFYIGGSVSGLLSGNNLVLQNNGTDDTTVSFSGAVVFNTPLDDLLDYDVSVFSQPTNPIQPCEIFNHEGTLAGDDVENVFVLCDLGDDLIYRNGFEVQEQIIQ